MTPLLEDPYSLEFFARDIRVHPRRSPRRSSRVSYSMRGRNIRLRSRILTGYPRLTTRSWISGRTRANGGSCTEILRLIRRCSLVILLPLWVEVLLPKLLLRSRGWETAVKPPTIDEKSVLR